MSLFKYDIPEDYVDEYELLPKGDYPAVINKVDVIPTQNDPNAWMLKLVEVVSAGKYKGKFIYHNIILAHSNPKAVNIGKSQLKKLKMACKLAQVTDTNQFLKKEHLISVDIETRQGYSDRNKIVNWHPIDIKQKKSEVAKTPVVPVVADDDDFGDDFRSSSAAPWDGDDDDVPV